MQINFSTSRLESLAHGDKKEEIRAKLDYKILKKYRQVLYFLSGPYTTYVDIWNRKSLNLEKYEDHRSIRLNDQWRLEIDFSKDGSIQVLDILQISNHYGRVIR